MTQVFLYIIKIFFSIVFSDIRLLGLEICDFFFLLSFMCGYRGSPVRRANLGLLSFFFDLFFIYITSIFFLVFFKQFIFLSRSHNADHWLAKLTRFFSLVFFFIYSFDMQVLFVIVARPQFWRKLIFFFKLIFYIFLLFWYSDV